MLQGKQTRVPQLLKPVSPRAPVCNKRSHNSKSMHNNRVAARLAATRESLYSNKDPAQPNIKKSFTMITSYCDLLRVQQHYV